MALALRFDVSRGKGPQYFKSAFLGYAVAVVSTVIVMKWFQAAQVGVSEKFVLFYSCSRTTVPLFFNLLDIL